MKYGYHKRSLFETAMALVKNLLGGKLSLGDHNAEISETYAMKKS
ncbi:Mobile element protein [Candidatus Enterovibrio altilux]|uniref:Mobile element protein n=1 Tax=Candidatus Enterovibrio altilux TaxID=1927128 RepID=A0A291B8Y0_9GAMM|nr:Mobile element protein [Candidatus Enterovibrio luxaltus]